MSHLEELKQLKQYTDELLKDPIRFKSFIRTVMGPPRRTVEGKDKENIILLLSLTKPYKETNNQHSWTDYYNIGGKEYLATYFLDDKNSPIIDEILPEDTESSM